MEALFWGYSQRGQCNLINAIYINSFLRVLLLELGVKGLWKKFLKMHPSFFFKLYTYLTTSAEEVKRWMNYHCCWLTGWKDRSFVITVNHQHRADLSKLQTECVCVVDTELGGKRVAAEDFFSPPFRFCMRPRLRSKVPEGHKIILLKEGRGGLMNFYAACSYSREGEEGAGGVDMGLCVWKGRRGRSVTVQLRGWKKLGLICWNRAGPRAHRSISYQVWLKQGWTSHARRPLKLPVMLSWDNAAQRRAQSHRAVAGGRGSLVRTGSTSAVCKCLPYMTT